MKLFTVVLAAALAAAAQQLPQVAVVVPIGQTINPGGTGTIQVQLSSTASAQGPIGGLQWEITFPAGTVSDVQFTAGDGSTAAQKQVVCAAIPPATWRCIAYGINTAAFADGIVAQGTVTFATQPAAPTVQVSILNSLAVGTEALAVAIQAGQPVNIKLSPTACDANADFRTDAVDVLIAVNLVLGIQSCGSTDLDKDGKCTLYDVQRIITAALGNACTTGPPPAGR